MLFVHFVIIFFFLSLFCHQESLCDVVYDCCLKYKHLVCLFSFFKRKCCNLYSPRWGKAIFSFFFFFHVTQCLLGTTRIRSLPDVYCAFSCSLVSYLTLHRDFVCKYFLPPPLFFLFLSFRVAFFSPITWWFVVGDGVLFLAFRQSIFVHVYTGVRYTMPDSSISLSGCTENKKSALPNIS